MLGSGKKDLFSQVNKNQFEFQYSLGKVKKS